MSSIIIPTRIDPMSDLHALIRAKIQRELDSGKTQMEIAKQCGVRQGAIYKYLNSDPHPDFDTVLKFSKGLAIPIDAMVAAETRAPYETPKKHQPTPSPHLQRLMDLVHDLDHDEIATLERCAEAFRSEEPEVRQHLIGQLKIIERLVNPDHAAPAKEKKRHGPPL